MEAARQLVAGAHLMVCVDGLIKPHQLLSPLIIIPCTARQTDRSLVCRKLCVVKYFSQPYYWASYRSRKETHVLPVLSGGICVRKLKITVYI